MDYIRCLLILAVVGLAELQSVKDDVKTVGFNITKSGCAFPFEKINDGCYFFSDVLKNFEEASDYCVSLTHGHVHEVHLAMLDYNSAEDQALLSTVASRDIIYWIGGKTDDAVNWYWLDNREVYLQAHFWDFSEPNEQANQCLTAQKNARAVRDIIRGAVYDHECSDSLNFICQTGPVKCPTDFIKIEDSCYLQSWTIGVPMLTWEQSHDYCMSLDMPNGYHADLAVINIQGNDHYHIMNQLAYQGHHVWIGAHRNTSDCSFKWINGDELPLESIYWLYEDPDCTGENEGVFLYHWTSSNNTFLVDDNNTFNYGFICQMFQDN